MSERTGLPVGRRDRHKQKTREALLSAARTLLADRSIEAISIDEIAEAADVAKGTFYNYFADKEAFVREMDDDVRSRMEAEIAQANQGVTDPASRIVRAMCSALRFSLKEPNVAIATARLFPHITDPSAPKNAGVLRDATEALNKGQATHTSADAMVTAIIGLVTAGVNRALDLRSDQVEAFVRDLGMILLRGLGMHGAESAALVEDAIESILRRSA